MILFQYGSETDFNDIAILTLCDEIKFEKVTTYYSYSL